MAPTPPKRSSALDPIILQILSDPRAAEGLSADVIHQSVNATLQADFSTDGVQKRLRKLVEEGQIFRYYRWRNEFSERLGKLYPVRTYYYFDRPNPTPEDAAGQMVWLES